MTDSPIDNCVDESLTCHDDPSHRNIVGNGLPDSLNEPIEREGEIEVSVNPTADVPKESPETDKVEKRKRKQSTRSASKPPKKRKSVEEKESSVEGEEGGKYSSAKQSKPESVKKEEKSTIHKLVDSAHSTPQCILCQAYPTTACGYASHLKRHRSTLKTNGLYLLCSCGFEVTSSTGNSDHTKACDGLEFTLHKLSEKVPPTPSTPQCLLCEAYPTTVAGYASHLKKQHNASLKFGGLYLICSCGVEVRSNTSNPDHTNKCDGLKFTIHKLPEKNPTTPQCVVCEAYPTTISGYTSHLQRQHKTSLNSSRIYLQCSCGIEVYSKKMNPNHNKKCDGSQFSLHKLDKE